MPVPRSITRENAQRGNCRKLVTFSENLIRAISDLARPSDRSGCSWPAEVVELATKIDVQQYSEVRRPVTNRDRNLLLSRLPAGIEVQRNDPRFA